MPMTLVPGGRLDTTVLPEDQQFASWSSHTPSRITPLEPGGFVAQANFWDLGLATVTDSLLDPFTAERDEALIRATGADHALMVLLYSGSVHFEADGRDELCEAGDIFVSDFRRPSRQSSTVRFRCATVTFGRAFVAEAIGQDAVFGRLPRSPETAVLAGFLTQLVAALPRLRRANAPTYARMLRDLFATAVAGMPRERLAGDQGRRSRALDYLEAQPAGSLSVEAMADALGMTRSTLYRLFRQDGGVLAFDRLRRLRALHRALTDPLERRSIGAIGLQHGFLDKAQLARAFRNAFGYSMSSLRARTRPSLDPDIIPPAERYRAMVSQLDRNAE